MVTRDRTRPRKVRTPQPETAPTDVTLTTDTPELLAQDYIDIQLGVDKLDAPAKWRWACKVAVMLAYTADRPEKGRKSDALAATIGNALRGKPYSGQWVRMWTAAAAKFPAGLQTPEDFRAFLLAGNGNAAKAAKKETETASSTSQSEEDEPGGADAGLRDYLNEIRKAVKRALAAKVTADEIRAALEDLI